MRVAPISCWRPNPDCAESFASLPYDVFDKEQARSYVEAHPTSFLAIDRPETAFEPGHDMYADEVYEKAAELLRERAQDGTLVHDDNACFYLYRLEQDDHAQIGLVCGASVNEYENGTILRHENTTRNKEEDRVRHIRTTGAQTGPIFLTYQDNIAVDALVQAACISTPLYDFTDEFGVRQSVWRIARPAAVEAFEAAFETVNHAYIADGHHRAASAVRICKEQQEQGEDRAGGLFLAVLFPASQLKVLPYNRVVLDRAQQSSDELIAAIQKAGFSITEVGQTAPEPQKRGQFGMYLAGTWYLLSFEAQAELSEADPVSVLDVHILQERVLAPLLNINDPRTSERIEFVGGNEGPERLAELAGSEGVAFSLYPTSVEELIAVSDAGLLMPPKSTWFEPKLRSGLFIRRI